MSEKTNTKIEKTEPKKFLIDGEIIYFEEVIADGDLLPSGEVVDGKVILMISECGGVSGESGEKTVEAAEKWAEKNFPRA